MSLLRSCLLVGPAIGFSDASKKNSTINVFSKQRGLPTQTLWKEGKCGSENQQHSTGGRMPAPWISALTHLSRLPLLSHFSHCLQMRRMRSQMPLVCFPVHRWRYESTEKKAREFQEAKGETLFIGVNYLYGKTAFKKTFQWKTSQFQRPLANLYNT